MALLVGRLPFGQVQSENRLFQSVLQWRFSLKLGKLDDMSANVFVAKN